MVALALALAFAGSTALAACSGSSSSRGPSSVPATAPTTAARTTTTQAPTITLRMTRAAATSILVGGGRADAAAVRRAQAVVDAYVRRATRDALLTGSTPKALSDLFVTQLAAKVKADASGALADAGLGRLRTSTTLAGSTRLTVLVDSAGRTGAISASVRTRMTATTAKGNWQVQRDGELLLLPVGPTWRIAGYDLTLTRTDLASGATTTTTTTSTSTTTSSTATSAGAAP